MPGLRERKRRRTVAAIHHAAMRLFADRGYAAVTVADIADAAEVSRATVFAYFGSKEEIVFGDAPSAVEGLRAALAPGDAPVVQVVRAWIRTLVGWMEPDIVLQRRLAEEIPAVGAVRSRVLRDIEAVIAEALQREVGPADPMAARLGAAALASALPAVEAEAAERFARGEATLEPDGVDPLFDAAAAFVEAGLERLRGASS